MSVLFLDSNVLVEGICSAWGLSKAILSLCAVRIHQITLQVAMRTGLRIASPFEFFQIVHSSA
jgi:hypothetical protein